MSKSPLKTTIPIHRPFAETARIFRILYAMDVPQRLLSELHGTEQCAVSAVTYRRDRQYANLDIIDLRPEHGGANKKEILNT